MPVVVPLGSNAGVNWSVFRANKSVAGPATVPEQVHADLLATGAITDPNYGWNKLQQCCSSSSSSSRPSVNWLYKRI